MNEEEIKLAFSLFDKNEDGKINMKGIKQQRNVKFTFFYLNNF